MSSDLFNSLLTLYAGQTTLSTLYEGEQKIEFGTLSSLSGTQSMRCGTEIGQGETQTVRVGTQISRRNTKYEVWNRNWAE